MKAEVIPERTILMNRNTKIGITAALGILVILSFVLAGWLSSVKFNAGSIAYLDSKKLTVTGLVAAVSAASTAIAAIPGDATTPIANQLASTTSWLLMVTVVIIAEKYLLTILIKTACMFILPAGLICWIIRLWTENELLKNLTVKLIVFGLAVSFIVPASVFVSKTIETTYHDSIQQSMDALDKDSAAADTEKDDSGKNIWSAITDSVQSVTADVIESLKTEVSHFIDAVAVLVVTSCIIPILVLMAFSWVIKLVFGLSLSTPDKLLHPLAKKKSLPVNPQ
jgi:hypothetical protein